MGRRRDLGPYDDLRGRLPAADTVVLLDHGLARCVWQALRRGRERSDFWRLVLTYRRRWRPVVLGAVRDHAPTATRVPVTKRGKLVAYLVPADEPQSNFQRMVAAGQVRLASGDLRDLPPPSPAEPGERLLSDVLREMRDGERY